MRNDDFGNRMKEYENVYRYYLPRRSYTIIRVDGKAFSSYTKEFEKPFDNNFNIMMDQTALYLCKNVMNCKLAYVQSDEISLVLADFDNRLTEAWFRNNLQKMCSVSASMATRAFNEARYKLMPMQNWAEFDSRVYQIPQRTEVFNYLVWRQQDATRNSILSLGQSLYTQKELLGKSCDVIQDMIFAKGVNWNDCVIGQKRGRTIIKSDGVWVLDSPPVFSKDKEYLNSLIPEQQ